MVDRTWLYHFTHVENLGAILANGLHCDSASVVNGLTVDVGMPSIKAARRTRVVPVPPGGFVSDYVPFYFAPRSPMMSSIHHGNVPQYQAGCSDLVYLVTSIEQVMGMGLDVVVTDRNAKLEVAEFRTVHQNWPELIDWDLMRARYWNNTPEEPDRRERRMAEALVHRVVPWEAFHGVGVHDGVVASEARRAIEAAGGTTPVSVRRDWYF